MPAPVNDNFANAIDLGGESGSLAGTTVDATGESSIATIGAILVQHGCDVWYKVHAGYFVCNSTWNPGFPYAVWTSGATFRHQIRVYAIDNTGTLKRYQSSGTGNPGYGQNEMCQHFPSEANYIPGDEVTWPYSPASYPDAWIYIQVDAASSGDDGGTFTLNWGRSPVPALGPVNSFKAWMTPPGKTVTYHGMASVNMSGSPTAYFNGGAALPAAYSADYYRISYAGGGYAMSGEGGAPDPVKSFVLMDAQVTFNWSSSTFQMLGDESTPMPGFMDATDLARLEIQNGFFAFATFQQLSAVVRIDAAPPFGYGVDLKVEPAAWPLWSEPWLLVTSSATSAMAKDATFALWRIHS